MRFLRRETKSGLIHAIGRRKSQKALLEHRIRKEGRFWDSESRRDELRENPKGFRIDIDQGVMGSRGSLFVDLPGLSAEI